MTAQKPGRCTQAYWYMHAYNVSHTLVMKRETRVTPHNLFNTEYTPTASRDWSRIVCDDALIADWRL